MTQPRDFLLVSGAQDALLTQTVLRWHRYLGGRGQRWVSHPLNCSLWGPDPAEVVVPSYPGTTKVACLILGAPIAFGSLDPTVVQNRLLQEYLRDGLAALCGVDGSFCGVIIDETASAIYVFTDRFGFRKAFVVSTQGLSYASSRAVVLGKGLDLRVDQAGVISTVMMGETLGTRTLFENCKALMPATAFEVRTRRRHSYWEIANFIGERPRTREITEDLRIRFNKACDTIINAQSVAAANLTGGFDTRAILSAALLHSKPVLAVTAGRTEARTVDAIVARTGIRHRYFDERDDSARGAAIFALLTDGECDATAGGTLLHYWHDVAKVAPSGCLHGGIGEAWRSYHYKFLWPRRHFIKRDPLSYLADRLMLQRRHLLRTFAVHVARTVQDVVREEIRSVWQVVAGVDATCAALDGFYLLERQRGLTRVTSAADLWNPAYAPFAHSSFVESALSYLGPQNRGETLHRAFVAGNNAALADVPMESGGTCRPPIPVLAQSRLAAHTAKHLAGRLIGPSMRSRLRRSASPGQYPHPIDTALLEATDMFDHPALRKASIGPEIEGVGHLAALGFLLQAQLESVEAIPTSLLATADPSEALSQVCVPR